MFRFVPLPHWRTPLLSLSARLTAAGLVCAGAAYGFALTAGGNPARSAAPQSQLDQQLREAMSVQAQANALIGLTRSEITQIAVHPDGSAVVPFEGRELRLLLHPHSVRSPHYKVRIQVDDGSLVDVDPGPVYTVRGVVEGQPDGVVWGSLEPDGLYVVITKPDGSTISVEPIGHRVDGARPGDHAVFRSEDVIPQDGVCGVTGEAPVGLRIEEAEGADVARGTVCRVAEVAIDADWQFYTLWGSSVSNVTARINAIINGVNQQYEAEVGIRHEITQIIVRTSSAANPYTSNNASTLLCQFRNHWNANHVGVHRDVAHLFTGRNLGSTLGIAWLNAICHISQNQCGSFGRINYALSVNRSNFNCAKDLTSHELGHNWSAPHCSCPSHTMNPSLTCSNVHHPSSITTIVNFRNTRTCLHDCQDEQEPEPGPSNTRCNTSLPVGVGDTEFNNIDAVTHGPSEPSMCNIDGDSHIQSDVWFRFPVLCDGVVTITICEATFPAKMGLYEEICPPFADILACDRYSCPTANQPRIIYEATAGELLVIRVGGHNGAQGTGVLNVDMTCPSACPADFNDDGEVDVLDMLMLFAAWGPNPDHPADLNFDDEVDVLDMLMLFAAWGSCP